MSAAPSAPPAPAQARLERERRRHALRAANAALWASGAAGRAPPGAADAGLKKNTAYIKRLRAGVGAEAREALLRDMPALRLEKYVEELVGALPEGLARCTKEKDVAAAGEILSAFHARFAPADFALPLSALLAAQLAPPNRTALAALPAETRERDEAARVARQKTLLRVAAEGAVIELLRAEVSRKEAKDEAGAEWLYGIVRELLASDREHANVPLLIALLKGLGPTLIGTAKDASTAAEASSAAAPPALLSGEMQARFQKLCETYFSTLAKRIVKDYTRLQDQDKRNHEAYIRSGEIFEDRQQSYERMTKTFERMHELGKSLSDLLGVPLPVLSESKASGIGLNVNLDSRSALPDARGDEEFTSGQSPWEDEDTRRFYEDVVDLGEMVPSSLLGGAAPAPDAWGNEDGEKTGSESKSTSPALSAKALPTSPELGTDAEPREEPKEEPKEAAAVAATLADETLSSGPAAQLGALLARLPEMTNRTMIDSAAVEFAFLNSKAARKRLVKHLGAVPRNRSDLLPYYARLTAAISRYCPDVGAGVVAILEEEFRYLQRKRNVDLAETRAKNMRFIAELTKFRVMPVYAIFHCFKVCLDDFAGANVDNLATLLEACGRFLLRTGETAERMRSMLEMLRRKRAAQNLDHRQVMLLDNAYYQCNPPERAAVASKVRTPLELYIRHLIYDVLSKRTLERVLKQLRKLDWHDADTLQWLREAFTRPWRIKFSHIHLLAILTHDLQAYHPDFSVAVVDTTCEQVRAGMEANIFKLNQRRVATVAYLGELYNYRVISSSVVFDQLWSLTTFGHAGGRPLPGQVSRLDAPDDYFRLRLICTLLDTCGQCFDRGALRRRLDDFLVWLNLYVLSKEQPLPMDSDFMLLDTLEALRPSFVLLRNVEHAARAVDDMVAAQRAAQPEPEADVLHDDALLDDDSAEERAMRRVGDDDDESDATHSASERALPRVGDDDEGEGGSSSEDDDVDEAEHEEEADMGRHDVAHDGGDEAEAEAEDDFARELAKMLAESAGPPATSSTTARAQQKGLFDAGLPFVRRQQPQQPQQEAAASHMRFSLLSRKGNKQQTHDVQVPLDAAIAIHTLSKQQREAAERQQLKQLVLSYEGREEVREDAAKRKSLEQSLKARGIKLTYADKG